MKIQFLIAILALLPSVLGLYSKRSPVVELTSDNFKKNVLSSEHVWVVEFFAPWCGHCQRLAPDYEKAAENLKGLVRVGAVDCDAEKNKPLCGQYQIQGFPTIKIFPSKSYNGNKVPEDYKGAREARAIVDAATGKIPNFVEKVASAGGKKTSAFQDFIAQQPNIPKAVLFTAKSTTTPLYKALAVDFHNTMVLAEVASSDTKLVQMFEIEKFPTLLVFPADSSEPVRFNGNLKHDELFTFLSTFAQPNEGPASSSSSGKEKEKESKPEPTPEPFVPEVPYITSNEQFKKECIDLDIGTCVIAFLGVEPEFEESVRQHQANIRVLEQLKESHWKRGSAFRFMWVDGFKQQELISKLGLSDMLPSLVLMKPARGAYRNYLGGFDEKSINKFLDETSNGIGRVTKLTFEVTLAE